MAEVWLATAHGGAGFTRRVAVKQLFARAADGGAFERMFLDEARITSRLHHAGIVAILDYGVEDGRAFQVLELVDGFDAARLAQWGRAQGRPLPVGLALHVCAMVGHALHFAHVATDDTGAPLNIVHRDVSPQNVLLSRAGDVKLSDFGIAFAEGRLEKTVGGAARGKPAYMAPEQAVRGPMDGRTDVFALGCVLHALLTGESALKDENALVDLLAGLELELSAALPLDVRDVLVRALRRNKAERWDSAEAMALACAQLVPKYLDGEPRTTLAAWVQAVAPAREVNVITPAVAVSSSPPRGRRVALAVIGAVVVVGGAVGLLRGDGDSGLGSGDAALTRAVASTLTGDGGTRESAPPAEALGPLRDDGFGPSRREGAPPSSPGDAALARASGARADGGTSAQPEPPARGERRDGEARRRVTTPALPAGAPGVLSIGGERFLRGEVFIDGVARGYAPGRFELTAGPHRVEVQLPTGERVGPRELVVTPQHTQSAPLTWEEEALAR